MEQLLITLAEAFAGFPMWAQGTILLVLAIVTIAAHIAPYTPTTVDDALIPHQKKLKRAFVWVWNHVTGNYRNAKNDPTGKIR